MATPFPDVKPFPSEAKQAVAAMGHNRPPVEIEAKAAFDELIDEKDGFRARFDNLIAAADRAIATDDESMGRCGELVKQIRAAANFVSDCHKAAKAPYLGGGRVIDGLKNEMIGPLDAAKAKVEGKQQVYSDEQDRIRKAEARRQREAAEAAWRAEQERIAAERAAYAEAETPIVAEIEQAPPPPIIEPEPEIIRGDYGAAVSTKRDWKSQVVDYEVAFMAVSENEKVREAIDKAIQGMVRGGARKIEGVRIWDVAKVSNR